MFINTVILSLSIAATPTTELKIGQRVQDEYSICHVTDDWDAVKAYKIPRYICLTSTSLNLHPVNPFESPSIEVKIDGQTISATMESQGPCFPEIKDSEYLKARITVSKEKLLNKDTAWFTTKQVNLEFCFSQTSGWFHTSTPRFSIILQNMSDEYHPDGDQKVVSYRFDD